MTIQVLVNGAYGKMGSVTVETLHQHPDFKLVGTTGRQDDLATAIQSAKPDIVIDFTSPEKIYDQIKIMIDHHTRPVIGTTGLSLDQISELQDICKKQQLGGIIAPNFSIMVALMIEYAQNAAKYIPDVEIIEMHHAQKKDAPSGTATKTAQMIAQSRQQKSTTIIESSNHHHEVRGKIVNGIPIHSVRLPGLVGHQTIIFGGDDETLTIRHDSIHRRSFMPGLLMACRKVMQINHLVYGLEKII